MKSAGFTAKSGDEMDEKAEVSSFQSRESTLAGAGPKADGSMVEASVSGRECRGEQGQVQTVGSTALSRLCCTLSALATPTPCPCPQRCRYSVLVLTRCVARTQRTTLVGSERTDSHVRRNGVARSESQTVSLSQYRLESLHWSQRCLLSAAVEMAVCRSLHVELACSSRVCVRSRLIRSQLR